MESESYFFKKGFVNLLAYKESFPIISKTIVLLNSAPQEHLYLLTDTKLKLLSILSNLANGYNEFDKKKKVEFYKSARNNLSSAQSNLLLFIDLNIFNKVIIIEQINNLDGCLKYINSIIKKMDKK